MKANWLIELDLFIDTEEDLMKAVEKSGRTYKTLKYIPFEDNVSEMCLKKFCKDDCVVFYGSLNFGRKLMKLPWVPGVYLDENKYECTSYYPVFGDLLLHNNYLMMPYGDLIRRKEHLFDLFGSELFIRPNSGFKEFTGMVATKNNFDDCIKVAKIYDVESNLLVMVSNAKELEREWRFVILNQEAISGSLYRDWSAPEKLGSGTVTSDYVLMNSHSVKELCNNPVAWEFANKCAKLYNPQATWTMDVARTSDGEYKLLEIGCFSCAGMYGNNLDIIVEKVSLEAEREWNEYFSKEI